MVLRDFHTLVRLFVQTSVKHNTSGNTQNSSKNFKFSKQFRRDTAT